MKLKVEGEIEIGNVEELGDACGRLFEKAKSILDAGELAPEHTTVHWPQVLADEAAKKAQARPPGHRFPGMRWY